MTSAPPGRPARWRPRRSRWLLPVGAVVIVGVVVAIVVVAGRWTESPSSSSLPLRSVGEVGLPGDGSRFDYASLDAGRGLLFLAHLGAGEVIEVDIRTHKAVRTIGNLSEVHGVLVVPTLHRVYATATGSNEVVAIDENTGDELFRSPTGAFPDGLAFDPRRGAIWTTNKTGGSETVIDAATGATRGTVAVGGVVGNVAYDLTGDMMLVAGQGRNELVVIDPSTLAVTRRVPLPGCEQGHGMTLDLADRLAFVACEANAALLTVDLDSWRVTDTTTVGADPDVLAYDHTAHRLYVAAESGTVTVLELRGHQLQAAGQGHLADGAHVVVVDPSTHRSYYPVPAGHNGRPALLEQEIAPQGQ